jgi:GTP cyclohydrolase I
MSKELNKEEGEKSIQQIKAEACIRQILRSIGEDPHREGLTGTPERVVNMWGEIFRGYKEEERPKVTTFANGKDGITYDQMIVDEGSFHSHCEHHMVPFFGKYYFAYIPDEKGQIIGLSKVARLVDYHSAKLQIQERLVHDIIEDIWNILSKDKNRPVGMGLVMIGEHLCKTMRGVKKQGRMTTIKLKGAFLNNPAVKSEFLQRCNI